MTIILDYDNDSVRIGSNDDIDTNVESRIIIFRQVKYLAIWQGILCEIINMICAENGNINVCLRKQSEGQITTIEEY